MYSYKTQSSNMAYEPNYSVKVMEQIEAERQGGAKAVFVSELLGENSHTANVAALKSSVRASAQKHVQTTTAPLHTQEEPFNAPLEFSTDYALLRDYRNRYGSPLWHRQKAYRSARQAHFLRTTIKKFAEPK